MPQIEILQVRPGNVVSFLAEPHLVLQRFSYMNIHTLLLLNKKGEVTELRDSQLSKTVPTVMEKLEDAAASEWRESIVGSKTVFEKGHMTTGGGSWMHIGTDPEIFAMDRNDHVIPAFAYLPSKPTPNPNGPPIPAIFFDGFQAEWTTNPSSCLGHQTDYVRQGMQGVLNAARKIDPQAKLSHLSVTDITFDPTLPPERYQLGCSPSMNAYDEPSVLMGTPELLPFRSAGWHMHFRGTTPPVNAGDPVDGFHSVDSKELAAKIIQLEDAILGTALVSFGQHHVDPRRRLMYGRAGEYRLGKTLEYRVPEVLMGCHPATWNLFWDLGRAVYWLGMRGFNFIWDADPTEVREAINNSNVALAQKILTKNIQVLNSIFKYLYRVGPLKPTPDWAPDKMAVKAILEGANAVLNDPTAVSRNWRLESGQTWQNESQGHLTGTNWRTSVPMLQRGEKL